MISRTKVVAAIAGTVLSSAGLLSTTAAPANASGLGYSPGPGASYNTTNWSTISKSSTTETIQVSGGGTTVGKVNSCRYGVSIWYTDRNGVRRNVYAANDGCSWGPVWGFTGLPYIYAKRGTTVQVTYRWEGAWYSGLTFRVE